MKNLFTESFDSKLLKYSLAAGAVLFGAKNNNAQVVVNNPNTTINSGGAFNFSFNGVQKFTLQLGSSMIFFTRYSAMLKGSTASAKWIRRGSDQVKALGTSYIVSSQKGFANNGAGLFISFTNNSGSGGFAGNTKFIGIKFNLTDGIHYGWIKLTTSSNVNQITINSYAYEQTVGLGINTGSSVSLPVELTTLTANTSGSSVELNWKTATEVNNYGFEIQRSESNIIPGGVDGWTKIGFVKGSGNSNSPKIYSFIDTKPLSGKVEYRLKQIDNDGEFLYSKTVEVTTRPTQFALEQNYPNPFNPTTTIQYAVPKTEHVALKVYDELGNEVKTLVDENKAAGQYDVQFNGSGLASGIYYYRISAGTFNEVKKLMLLK